MLIVGFGVLVIGIGSFSWPVAMIVGGALLIVFGIALDRHAVQ